MSFAFAGALAGAGKALQDIAEEKRLEARRILEAELKGRAKATRAGGGAAGGGKTSQRGLSNSDEVRLEKAYESAFGDSGTSDAIERPSLSQYKSEVLRLMSEENLDRVTAEARAAKSWQGSEVETGEMEEPGFIGSLFGKKPTPKKETRYGFGAALGEEPPSAPPTADSGPVSPAKPSAPAVNPDDALAQARDAIAKGADRNIVIDRLRSMGIDPKGL